MPRKEKDDYLLPDVEAAEADRRKDAKAKSLANLKPWKAGQSGNVAGRRSSQVYVKEAVNVLMTVGPDGPRYTLDEIAAMAEDGTNGPTYVMACRRILIACQDPAKWVIDEDGTARYAGSDSEPGRAFEQIADRLEGKPTATVHIKHDDVSPEDLRRELLAHVANRPGLLRLLLEQVPVLEAAGALPPAESPPPPTEDA